jgi:FtsH-binding integral membrane protein
MSDNQFSNSSGRSTAIQIPAEEAARIQAQFFAQVYGWMAAGLSLTGGVALFSASSTTVRDFVFGTPFVFLGLIIAELLIVGFMTARAARWSRTEVQAAFIAYALLNGVTLSVIFLRYTADSIASTFFVSGATFAVMSLYGYYTKSDLTGWGKLLSMALIGLVIAMVVNIFIGSTLLATATSAIGVLLFTALTAYDTQKLKSVAFTGVTEGEEASDKASILGALTLYLDFINLFLFLLRFFGRRR